MTDWGNCLFTTPIAAPSVQGGPDAASGAARTKAMPAAGPHAQTGKAER